MERFRPDYQPHIYRRNSSHHGPVSQAQSQSPSGRRVRSRTFASLNGMAGGGCAQFGLMVVYAVLTITIVDWGL